MAGISAHGVRGSRRPRLSSRAALLISNKTVRTEFYHGIAVSDGAPESVTRDENDAGTTRMGCVSHDNRNTLALT